MAVQGWRRPPQKNFRAPGNICWTLFKSIGHGLKNLGHSQKTLRLPLVSQAGYGPAVHTLKITTY